MQTAAAEEQLEEAEGRPVDSGVNLGARRVFRLKPWCWGFNIWLFLCPPSLLLRLKVSSSQFWPLAGLPFTARTTATLILSPCLSLFTFTESSTTTSPSSSLSAPPVDPAEWPSFLSDSDRTEQVIRGPQPIKEDFLFPKRQDGRSFHYHYTYRQLVNGEKVKRSWLTYSKSRDAVYCFCCKLFSKKSLKLATEGQRVNILGQHRRTAETA